MKIKKIVTGLSTMLVAGSALAGTCDNGNLAAWDLNQNPAGNLNVTDTAAMGGTACGLQLTTLEQQGGAARHWVEDDTPNEEKRYRAAFCFDPNDVQLPNSGPERRLKIHIASCGSPQDLGCFGFDNLMWKFDNTSADMNNPDYRIFGYVRDFNQPGVAKRNVYEIDVPEDGPFRIEYDLNFTNENDAYLKVWVNATQESDIPALNLTGLSMPHDQVKGINLARIGQMGVHESIAAGQDYYFDEFESRRQTFIGGTCN